MNLLIIDNNIDEDSWGAADLRRLVRQTAGAELTITCRRAPHGDLPPNPSAFDRIVISGSKTSALDDAPWIAQLHAFIRKAVDQRKPILGVCYGHQSLARALGSKALVRKAEQAEFGWTRIKVTRPTPLFEGLPESFYTFSSHFDEVSVPPPGAVSVAASEACAVQAFHLEGTPVFGIQFHPEKDIAGAEKTLAFRKKVKEPKVLLHPERSRELYDPKVGETLFRNFMRL